MKQIWHIRNHSLQVYVKILRKIAVAADQHANVVADKFFANQAILKSRPGAIPAPGEFVTQQQVRSYRNIAIDGKSLVKGVSAV